MKECYLIDNINQEMLYFKSIKELKDYAKENDLIIKRDNGLTDNITYYTINEIIGIYL